MRPILLSLAFLLSGCLPSGKVDWPEVRRAIDALPEVCYRDGSREVCISRLETPTPVLAGPEECKP